MAMLYGANFDKMLEVDPESCAQAFKGSCSVNHVSLWPRVKPRRKVQRGTLRLRRWGSVQRQTPCWRKRDSNGWSHNQKRTAVTSSPLQENDQSSCSPSSPVHYCSVPLRCLSYSALLSSLPGRAGLDTEFRGLLRSILQFCFMVVAPVMMLLFFYILVRVG